MYLVLLAIPTPQPMKPAPLNPALPFIRSRRTVAFYQNMMQRKRATMSPDEYAYFLRMHRYYRTK